MPSTGRWAGSASMPTFRPFFNHSFNDAHYNIVFRAKGVINPSRADGTFAGPLAPSSGLACSIARAPAATSPEH